MKTLRLIDLLGGDSTGLTDLIGGLSGLLFNAFESEYPTRAQMEDLQAGSDPDATAMANVALMKNATIKIAVVDDDFDRDDYFSEGHLSTPSRFIADPVGRLLINLCNFLVTRAPVYGAKLKALKETEEKGLLSQVGSISEGGTRFVDTPDGNSKLQNYFDDDTHATSTTATKSSTSSDYDTPMGRLRDILANYPDLAKEFSDEMEREFALYA